jgi:hypothetical protein
MTTTLRNGTTVEDRRLDRLPSERTDHLEKYPLTATTAPSTATPLLGGFNWYSNCFQPRRIFIRGHSYAILPGPRDLGSLAGGHCICFPAWGQVDLLAWRAYYDQQLEGRCVEFGKLRMMSLFNRKRYDITSRWHYWQDQREDEWAGGSYPGAVPQYEGTSVRAGLEGLRKYGAIPALPSGFAYAPSLDMGAAVRPEEGIAAYRWITDWNDARRVTRTPDWMPGLIYLQSWGTSHPHRTIMPDETGERLLREQGELGVVTDR